MVAVGYAVTLENKSQPRGNSLLTKQYNNVADAIFSRAAGKVACHMALTKDGKSRMQAWGLPYFPFGYIVVKCRQGMWPVRDGQDRTYSAYFVEYAQPLREPEYLGECDIFGFPVEKRNLVRA